MKIIYFETLSIIFFSFFFSFLIPVFLIGFSSILASNQKTPEKMSAYECGFNPFDDARGLFNVKFFLVGILFLIFDVEIIFLLPIIFLMSFLSLYVYIFFLLFFSFIILGFFYEWRVRIFDEL